MKVNKKIVGTIISNTVMFVAVLLFVGVFKGIFGDKNTQVGVSTIVLALSLLSRDLTKKPLKNFGFLLIFNVVTVLGAYIFESHLWFGFIINFLIIGGIGYLFTYEVKRPFNMLFGLQYILLIGSPINSEQLPMRLIAAFVSACIIMGLQLLANKNKLAKSSQNILSSIEENILLKINLIKENKNIDDVNKIINNLISDFKILIFESGQTDFKMDSYGSVSVDILSCIENINTLLDNIQGHELKDEILSDIYIQFENVKNGKFDSNNINTLLSKYKNDLVTVNGFLNVFEILQDKLKEFKDVVEDKGDDLSKDIHIPEEFKMMNGHKKNFKKISYRVAYAIRAGLLFALTGFLTKAFDLEFGKWMMFTVFALTQPYAEFAAIKAKKRIFGTTVGVIIVFISFLIVKDTSSRMTILLVAGYLMSYVDEYKYKSILITICATIIDAVGHPNANYVIMNRLVFVMIGVVISLLANRFLLRREYKHAEDSLINIQKGLSNRMLEEVILSKNTNENSIRNIFLLPALVEDRVNTLELSIEKDFILKNKSLINDIYQIYLLGNGKYKEIMKNINNIMAKSDDIKIIDIKLKEYAETKKDIREKALAMSILRIVKNAYYINREENNLEELELVI